MRGTGPADDERPFARDLHPLKDNTHLRFALRIHVPDVRISTGVDDDGVNVWIHDGVASWAARSSACYASGIASTARPAAGDRAHRPLDHLSLWSPHPLG